MAPSTHKQWIVEGPDKGKDGLVLQENKPVPGIAENEVLVKLQAASLNFRDLAISKVRKAYSPISIPSSSA